MREARITRLSWEPIDLDAGVIVIDAEASKTHRRRVIHLREAAIEWLRLAKQLGAVLPVSHMTARRYLRVIRGALNLP